MLFDITYEQVAKIENLCLEKYFTLYLIQIKFCLTFLCVGALCVSGAKKAVCMYTNTRTMVKLKCVI